MVAVLKAKIEYAMPMSYEEYQAWREIADSKQVNDCMIEIMQVVEKYKE